MKTRAGVSLALLFLLLLADAANASLLHNLLRTVRRHAPDLYDRISQEQEQYARRAANIRPAGRRGVGADQCSADQAPRDDHGPDVSLPQRVLHFVEDCTQPDCLPSVAGLRAVIVGGFSPLSQGSAVGLALHAQGAQVLLGSKHVRCSYNGTRPQYPYPVQELDVTDRRDIDRFVEWVRDTNGWQHVDVLYITPGISALGNVSSWAPGDELRLYEINHLGPRNVHDAFTRAGLLDSCSKVIEWGSNAAEAVVPFLRPYSDSKASKRAFNTAWNAGSIMTGHNLPVHVLLEPTQIASSFGFYDIVFPNGGSSLDRHNRGTPQERCLSNLLAASISEFGVSIQEVARQVIELTKTPNSRVNATVLVYDPPESALIDDTVSSHYTVPVNEHQAFLGTSFAIVNVFANLSPCPFPDPAASLPRVCPPSHDGL